MTTPLCNEKPRPLNGELTIIQLKVTKPGKLFRAASAGAANSAASASASNQQDELLEECCEISDNSCYNSLTQGASDLKDFSSYVWPNSVIMWLAKLKKKHRKKGYSISLDAIEITSPDEKSEFFHGKLQPGGGMSIVVWSREVIKLLSNQKYAIYFTLYKGDKSKQFKIDPRLRPNTGSTAFYLVKLRDCLAPPPEDIKDDELIQPIIKQVEQLKVSIEKILAGLKK